MYRMQVTDNTQLTTYGTPVVLARNWDGMTQTGDPVAVRVVQGHAPNSELFAMSVVGGTGYLYSGANVTLLELLVPANISMTPHQVLKVVDSTGRIGTGSVALE